MEIRIVYNRKNQLKNGKAPIEVLVYLSRTDRPIRSTKIMIEPQHWDDSKKRIKKTHPDADFLNTQLTDFVSRLQRHLLQQKVSGAPLSIDHFDRPATARYFYEFIENQVIPLSNAGLSAGTGRIYNRMLRYLREYSPDVTFEELTVSFMEGFNRFLIDRGLQNNSRASLMNKVKKCLRVAEQNDLIMHSKNPFHRGFSVREIEPEKQSLTLAELTKLENLDMTGRPELKKTRDMFLFCCYTGVRFGDLITFSFEEFETLPDGRIRITYTPGKTQHTNGKVIRWIISDVWGGKAAEIVREYFMKWDRFRNHPKENRLFWNYANQVYNRNLKELQRFAEIETTLTSHLARHTCITLLVNDFGFDITKAQLIAGHSSIEMTMKYLRVQERDISAAAQKINWN